MLGIQKKLGEAILVILIATITMGIINYSITKILNSVIKYPHYEWYMYKISFLKSLTISLLYCILSYLIYRILLLFLKSGISIKFKILLYWFSFFITYFILAISAGGSGNLNHPITIKVISLYFLMGILIPLIEQKVNKFNGQLFRK